MKIMKFGGSSIADYPQMLKVFDIVNNTEGKKIVVLSACKSITDKLEEAAILFADRNQQTIKDFAIKKDNIVRYIEEHHLNILKNTLRTELVSATTSVKTLLRELQNILEGISFLNELTKSTKDSVLSFGELLSSVIFHFICKEKGVNSTLLDARDMICTDDNYNEAIPNVALCYENITKEYAKVRTNLVITQGFIASYNDNYLRKTTTLGRGGSDYSASIIGAILDAEEIQIWTDVNGILSADPRYYNNTFTIKQMSFAEIKDLSFWGAKVLHPKTIQPAIERNINIRVLNTFNPTFAGTLLTSDYNEGQFIINSVIAKENCILNINTTNTTGNPNNELYCDSIYSGYCNGKNINLLERKNVSESVIAVDNEHYIPCSAICITGANLTKNSILFIKFLSSLNCLEGVDILQFIFEFSFNSVLLVVGKCDIHKVVDEIHNIAVKLHNIKNT
jgi:aspartokinase/homoserine dehydrogenase 1